MTRKIYLNPTCKSPKDFQLKVKRFFMIIKYFFLLFPHRLLFFFCEELFPSISPLNELPSYDHLSLVRARNLILSEKKKESNKG